MKNEHTSSTAPLLIGMAAGAALGAAGVMATNTSQRQMRRIFDLEASGYFYSRLQNPTNDAVAARIAANVSEMRRNWASRLSLPR